MLPITTFFFSFWLLYSFFPFLPSEEEAAVYPWLWLGVVCLPPATSYSSHWLCRNSI